MQSPFAHALLLIAAIFALYRPALDYDFVWDDTLYVVQNPAVQSWDHATAAFTSPQTTWSSNPTYTLPAWRPLRNISYLIDHTIYGFNPIGWHLTNIMLHAAAAVLLLLLLRRLVTLTNASHSDSENISPAAGIACLLATAAWALHPVQTEIVAWIKSRDDLLATPLMFAALLLALPRSPSATTPISPSTPPRLPASAFKFTHQILLPALLFTAALLSKENTIILAALYPIILFLIITPRPPRLSASALKHFLSKPLTIIFPLIALTYLLTHHHILGRTSQAAHPGDTPAQTILTMLHALARYTQLTLWPWPPTTQSADYDNYPIITNPLNPQSLIGLLLLLFLLLLFFLPSCLRVKKSPATRLTQIATATILISLLPFANIIPMMQILAERFLYLPTAGVAILLTAFLIRFSCFAFPLSLRAFVSNFLALILIAALTYQTHHRLPTWTNELTLFNATRHANPTSWRPADQYTKALLKNNQTTAALTIANQNLKQFPGDPDIIRTAALTHLLNGQTTTGIALTNLAIKLQPNDPRASHTLETIKRMQTNQPNT